MYPLRTIKRNHRWPHTAVLHSARLHFLRFLSIIAPVTIVPQSAVFRPHEHREKWTPWRNKLRVSSPQLKSSHSLYMTTGRSRIFFCTDSVIEKLRLTHCPCLCFFFQGIACGPQQFPHFLSLSLSFFPSKHVPSKHVLFSLLSPLLYI